MRLKDLSYGSIIKYRRKVYVKIKGVSGDIVMDVATGGWHFIEGGSYSGDWPTKDWKKFKVLFGGTY